MIFYTRLFIPLCILIHCTACSLSPYSITFNNNVIYSPNAALESGVLSDPSLQACLNQVLQADQTKLFTTVTLLACPGASITTLSGIEKMTRLEQLDVSNNAITTLNPLLELKNLRVLNVSNNAVTEIRSLLSMPILRFVALIGNDNISCDDLVSLEEKLGNTLSRPLNCKD